jgi:hypothetical protein
MRELAMEYRLYLIDALGKIQASHDIRCEDEAVAYMTAQKLFQGNRFEVWDHARRVYPAESQEPAKAT